MCWSAEVSFTTFFAGVATLMFLYIIKYDMFLIAFVGSFVIMQLLEGFIWLYIKQPNITMIFSIFQYILILSQPIIILYFTPYRHYIKYYVILQIIGLLVAALFFGLTFKSFRFMPKIGQNGHLSWNWLDNSAYIKILSIIYLIFYLTPVLLLGNYVIFFISVITLLYSVYNYTKYKTVSSMWCWFANILLIVMLIDAIRLRYMKSNQLMNFSHHV